MGWAAAMFNDFHEEDTDNLELRGIEVPDVIVQTGEEEDAEEEAEAERERVLLQSIGPFNPPAGLVVMDALPEEIGSQTRAKQPKSFRRISISHYQV